MILADSNILIDYYRDRNSELAAQVDSLPIAVCGIVKSEVLHGARTNQEIDDMLASFQTFDQLTTDEYDFKGVGLMLQNLRAGGIQVPLADAMIAFKHFRQIQLMYPELELYAGI